MVESKRLRCVPPAFPREKPLGHGVSAFAWLVDLGALPKIRDGEPALNETERDSLVRVRSRGPCSADDP